MKFKKYRKEKGFDCSDRVDEPVKIFQRPFPDVSRDYLWEAGNLGPQCHARVESEVLFIEIFPVYTVQIHAFQFGVLLEQSPDIPLIFL